MSALQQDTASRVPAVTYRSSELAWTSYLRVVAMVAVVVIHVAGLSYAQIQDHDSAAWTLAAFLTFSTKWAVPVFVMVSGMLLLRPPADPSPGLFYRRRLSRIGIPLLFWHLVYVLVYLSLASEDVGWRDVVARVLQGEAYTGLYFFWLILGLYLVTPLIWPAVSLLSRRTLAVTAVLLTALPAADLVTRRVISELGGAARSSDPTLFVQFLPYVGFYLLGYVLRDVVMRGVARVALGLVTLALALELTAQVVYVKELSPTLHHLLTIVAPFSYQGPLLAMCAVGVFLLGHSVVHSRSRLARPAAAGRARWLANLTLGVFGCHLLVAYLLARAAGHPAPLGATTVPGIIGQNLLVVVLAFVLSAVLSRIPGLRRTV